MNRLAYAMTQGLGRLAMALIRGAVGAVVWIIERVARLFGAEPG